MELSSITDNNLPPALMPNHSFPPRIIEMEQLLDRIGALIPYVHWTVFVIGFSSNLALLFATFLRTPRTLTASTYSIMIKFGTINDLICVCCDFFTMQRMLVLRDNLLYLSSGPCSSVSTRSCYLAYCMQLSTLVYSYYVMLASFAYRLWILHREPPKTSSVILIMIITLCPPAITGFAFIFAQADIGFVREFLTKYSPKYDNESGALSGHTGMTPQLIFTILYVISTPGPVYVGVLVIRHKILSKLREFSNGMSVRTRTMHCNFVKALTIHAALPPITLIGASLYVVLFFELYYHPTLEKACYTFAAFPPALGAFCTLYYVEPYRLFVSCRPSRASLSSRTVSITHSVVPPPPSAHLQEAKRRNPYRNQY